MERSKNPGVDPKQKALYELRHMLGLTSIVNADEDLQDVVFVAIDCEAFESNQKHTTEIGISVLDTRAIIKNLPPGEHAEAWIEKIQHAHYRVIEYSHEVNHRFVKGCPDSFDFGPTTWIRRADAAPLLSRIFQNPTHLPLAADLEQHPSSPEDEKQPTPKPETRKIILVTHSGRHDIDYLRNLAFDLDDADVVPNLLRKLDTQWLVSPKRTPTNLANLLRFLGIPAEHLHNAGNDAAYTLRALLVIALREEAEPGSVAKGLREEVMAMAARAMAAAARVTATTTATTTGEEVGVEALSRETGKR